MTEIATRTTAAEPEIDEELLEEAQRQIGAASPNEAINAALLELVEDRRARRGRAYDNLQRMAEEGGLDFDAIEEADR
jgi:Arc/MetJ family transcription regulator